MAKYRKALRSCILLLIFVLGVAFAGCTADTKREYYSNKENYIRISGTVSYTKISDDGESCYFALENLSEQLSDDCFKLTGENYQAAVYNGLLDKLQLGSYVEVTFTPRYFGDGFVFPVAGLIIDGDEILRFSEGSTDCKTYTRGKPNVKHPQFTVNC